MEKLVKGGKFMVQDLDAKDIFIPEEFDEEQRMVADTCRDFLDTEVFPNLEKIDKQEDNIGRTLLEKAGELGLLGISTPEELKGAEKIANIGDAVLTVLVSIEENAILVLDPMTYETVAIKKPMSFNAEAGSEIPVLKTEYGIFALANSDVPQEK